MSERRSRALTHEQFYQLCELLKERKEEFIEKKFGIQKVLGEVIASMGIDVSSCTLRNACKTVGLTMRSTQKRVSKSEKANRDYHTFRALLVAVRNLYLSLGQEIPSGLETAYKAYSRSSTKGMDLLNDFVREIEEDADN